MTTSITAIRARIVTTIVAAAILGAAAAAPAQDTPAPVQTCAATNVGGFAYEGFVCGGSVADNCTPGAIYRCEGGGVLDPDANCVLAQVCNSGCLTGTSSTPLTVNTRFPVASDACFVGTRPLTLSTSDTVGGRDVTVTATLSESQQTPNGPILNLRGGGTLVPHPFCAVPFRLAPGSTSSPASVSFDLPTAVVDSLSVANLDALISYRDTSGFTRTLVSVPWTIRLQPGGTEPPAPPVKSITVGPSILGPGQPAVVDVELAKFAPARGIRVTLSSSDPAVAAIIENGQPFVMGACTTGGGAANVQAADFVDATKTVTISGTSGAPNEVPATDTITVTETVLDLSKVSLNPSAVLAGGSATATLTMTRPAAAGGAQVSVTSSSSSAIVPATVTVPAGEISTSFPVTTRADASTFASATIGGSFEGDFDASAQLVVWPAGTPQVVEALSLNPASVTGPTSSTGTVTMRYAPSAPAQVALSSSNTSVARVPSAVTVPAGATQASFAISTSDVSVSTASTIAASFGGSSQTANITVKAASPPPASAALSAYSVTPTTVTGGQSATGVVTLASAAPAGGVAVELSSQLPGTASVPAGVVVPEGATSASFTITTFPPSGTTTVSLSAALNGGFRFTSLTVNPAAPSGGGGGGIPSGFLSPASNAADSGGDGNGFQTSPASAYADDGAAATDTNSGTGTSTSCADGGKDRHRFYDFGFAVPAGSGIAGLEVRLNARADSTSGTPRMCVQLSADGGATWTAAKTTGTLGTSLTALTLGGAADTWGRAWSDADLANARFRVRVTNVASSTSRDFFLDSVAVRPHFSTASTPAAATLTVTATGRSGTRITSAPSGINVAVGSTGSASFTTGTSITLSVSDGREAVWSGACSSGGNRRRTCAFTLNGNASVTANVQ